jgi:ATP-dependent Clp protease ATP-binding subunit ClpB
MSNRPKRYVGQAKLIMEGADALAKDHGHLYIEPLHVLREMLEHEASLWKEMRTDRRDLIAFVDVRLARLARKRGYVSPSPSPTLMAMMDRAADLAAPGDIRSVDILLAMVKLGPKDDAGELLREFEVAVTQVEAVARSAPIESAPEPARPSPTEPGVRDTAVRRIDDARPAVSSRSYPSSNPDPDYPEGDPLLRFGTDLTAKAAEGGFDPIVGRSAELRRLQQILCRRTKNNPVLIGEPGVGKRTIVHSLAHRIIAGDVPSRLKDRRIVALETGALLAGARMRGELEQRIKMVVDALRQSQGQTILFAEELPSLLGAGGSTGQMGTGDLLKPALARGEVRIIGRTTPQDYRQHVEKDPTLARSFQPVPVLEPTEKEVTAILRGVVDRYEIHHSVRISDPACIAAIRYSERYIPDRCLPDKAIDLIDEAASRLRLDVDSVPGELDEIERRLEGLQIEHDSLQDDHDPDSLVNLKSIEQDIADLLPKSKALRRRWRTERENLDLLKTAKAGLDEAQHAERRARRDGDIMRAADLRHHLIPQLEGEVEKIEAILSAERSPLVREVVMEEDIARIISDWTGIPVAKMLENEAERLLRMEESLEGRVKGQSDALKVVSKAVRRGRVGLRDPGRPIGSFLFLGPTGVGKTELAKALAEFVFDDEAAMTRIDMSEFMERHMVARLVGPPPGYVDREEGGHLTEAVRSRPYSVVLLDEIEKAHRDVFDLLLQVLDDGRLTDGRGRTVDFTNTIIVMTSNIGGVHILEHDGDHESLQGLLEEQLKSHLRPEFLNRIDDVVIFRKLEKDALKGIVGIQVRKLSAILTESGMSLDLTPAAIDLIVEKGYDPAFGARPVRRVILKEIQDPLAEEILRSGYSAGDKITVDAQDGVFVFEREGTEQPVSPPTDL